MFRFDASTAAMGATCSVTITNVMVQLTSTSGVLPFDIQYGGNVTVRNVVFNGNNNAANGHVYLQYIHRVDVNGVVGGGVTVVNTLSGMISDVCDHDCAVIM